MVCEDDVLIYPGSTKLLRKYLDGLLITDEPLLIRMANSGANADVDLTTVEEVNEIDDVYMSNPAYLLNDSMARSLLQNFKVIATTSDIWLHDQMARQ